MGKFATFLFKLNTDSKLAREFARDPAGAMKNAGLSKPQMDAVLGRNSGTITELLLKENPVPADTVVIGVWKLPALMPQKPSDQTQAKPPARGKAAVNKTVKTTPAKPAKGSAEKKGK